MPLDFDYWTDPLCVWAFVGHAKLERLLDTHGDRVRIRYRVIPVFGDIPTRFESGSWSASGRQGKAEVTRRIAREQAGLEISGKAWLDPSVSSSWKACEAIKAVELLEDDGVVEAGTLPRYLWRLQQAFFQEDRITTHRREQLAVAEELGVGPEAMKARLDSGQALAALFRDHEERNRLKLRGSPSYVFDGGRTVIYGNFAYEVLDATVHALVGGTEIGCSHC